MAIMLASFMPAVAEDASPPNVMYDVIINKEEGIKAVSGAGAYFPGDTVTINAEQENGYVFSNWYVTYENPYTKKSGDFYLGDRKATFKMPDGKVTVLAQADVLSDVPDSTTDDSPMAAFDYSVRSIPENGDATGAEWFPFMLKAKKVTKTSILLKWNSIPGAFGYAVYGAPCGSRYKYITKTDTPEFQASGLSFGTYYKYFVAALDASGNVSKKSTSVHVTTKGGKYGNYKKIKYKKKLTLKVGQEKKIKAKPVKEKSKGKSKPVKTHKKIRYYTTNKFVARAYGNGEILATGKGTCYIYAYTQDGKSVKMKVKVKKAKKKNKSQRWLYGKHAVTNHTARKF